MKLNHKSLSSNKTVLNNKEYIQDEDKVINKNTSKKKQNKSTSHVPLYTKRRQLKNGQAFQSHRNSQAFSSYQAQGLNSYQSIQSQKYSPYSSPSIYHKFNLGNSSSREQIFTEQSEEFISPNSAYCLERSQNTKNSKNNKNSNKSYAKHSNKQNISQELNHQDCRTYDFRKQNKKVNQFNNLTSKTSKQFIKRQITQKIDRVCQRIDNLSRQKQANYKGNINESKTISVEKFNKNNTQYQQYSFIKNQTQSKNLKDINDSKQNQYEAAYNSVTQRKCQKHKNNAKQSDNCIKNISNQTKNYKSNSVSNVGKFYNISPSELSNYNLSYQQISQNQQQNFIQNRTQQKILPEIQSYTQKLEKRLSQMQRDIRQKAVKISKLQELLLQQKDHTLKKEKQWLLKQNQLLNKLQQQEYYEVEYQQDQLNERRQDTYSSNQMHFNKNIVVQDPTKSPMKSKSPMKINTQYSKNQGLNLVHNQNQINNNNKEEYEIRQRQTLKKFSELLKLNKQWIELMGRTKGDELPGTAFRVKEQMHLHSKYIDQLQQNLLKYLTVSGQLNFSVNNISSRRKQKLSYVESPYNLQSLAQSQVFLLESYCSPVESRGLNVKPLSISSISKRGRSNKKLSSRKALNLSNTKSQSKSIQGKGLKLINQSKSRKLYIQKTNQIKHPEQNKYQKFQNCMNRAYPVSEQKSQYYADQVFYNKKSLQTQFDMKNLKDNNQNCQTPLSNIQQNNSECFQLYYMLQIQAQTIESFIHSQKLSQYQSRSVDSSTLPSMAESILYENQSNLLE